MVGATAVRRLVDGYLFAVRRVEWLVEVVHAPHGYGEHLIEFDYYLVRHAADSGHDAHSGSGDNGTVLTYIGCLDNGKLGFGEEPVTQVLRHMGEVHVEVVCTLGIDFLTHGLIGLIRSTELHSVCACQSTVTTVSHGSTGLEAYTEGNTLSMQFLGPLCKGKGNCLGHSGSSKATHAQDITMLY